MSRVRAAIVAVEKQLLLYSECEFVASGTQRKMLMRRTVFCGLPSSTILFHIIS